MAMDASGCPLFLNVITVRDMLELVIAWRLP
jgi:hypothetical protein